MDGKTYGSLVEVFRGNLWEAELVKGLLVSAGVDAMIKDETVGVVTSPYLGMDDVLVMVNKEEEVYARKVVKERRV